MDTSKIIKGVVSNGRYTVTAPIVKEDYGLYLQIEGVELPSTYEVDFSNSENSGTSVTMIGNSDGVLIPSQFIKSGKDVFAFLYHVGADFGRTVYKFRIPNKCRPDRTEEQPTPEEQSVIDQAIGALNTAVEQTAQDVVDAEASAQAAGYDADRAEEARSAALDYAEQAEASATNAEQSATASANSASASAQSASQSAQIKADVENLADDAQGYAQSAEQSAQNAHTYALSANVASSTAENFADVASGYASQAQSYSQTASAKAQEASQSATTASQKATESAQSASQAMTYKTDAETAKVASQTAQGLAESARDSAISAKTDAESAKADAESARDEAVNAVASISGALDDKADVITDVASGAIASFPDGADDLPLKSLVVNIDPVQDLSHGDPSPENICPISGWTGMEIQRDGKNLFDIATLLNGAYNNAQFNIPSSTTAVYRSIKIYLKAGTYTLSALVSLDVIRTLIDGGFDSTTYSNKTSHTFTTAKDGYVGLTVRRYDRGDWDSATTLQIEHGSTATDYEPYKGTTLPINWQTEAGTVYGGSLDVLSGILTVDRAMVDLGTLDWYNTSTATSGINRFRCSVENLNIKLPPANDVRANIICDRYATETADRTYLKRQGISMQVGNNKRIYVFDPQYNDATDFKASFDHLYLCYELAEPIEIQLTPTEVSSLLGVNNIFADTGDTACEYRADTKAWVQRKIAEAISALS